MQRVIPPDKAELAQAPSDSRCVTDVITETRLTDARVVFIYAA